MKTLKEAYRVMADNCDIEVGDFVKILRVAKDSEMGWSNSWARGMNKLVGKTGEVISIDNDGFAVQMEGDADYWHYPFFVLEKVKPLSVKVGPAEIRRTLGKTVIHIGNEVLTPEMLELLLKKTRRFNKA